jgi:hypothetical protein
MQAFVAAVKQLARLPVKDGEVSFEIELTTSHGVDAAGERGPAVL